MGSVTYLRAVCDVCNGRGKTVDGVEVGLWVRLFGSDGLMKACAACDGRGTVPAGHPAARGAVRPAGAAHE